MQSVQKNRRFLKSYLVNTPTVLIFGVLCTVIIKMETGIGSKAFALTPFLFQFYQFMWGPNLITALKLFYEIQQVFNMYVLAFF